MSILIHVPIAWRVHVGGNATVTMKEAKVGLILQELEALYPGLQGRLLEADVAHPALNILVDGVDVRLLQELETYVHSGSEVYLIPEYGKG